MVPLSPQIKSKQIPVLVIRIDYGRTFLITVQLRFFHLVRTVIGVVCGFYQGSVTRLGIGGTVSDIGIVIAVGIYGFAIVLLVLHLLYQPLVFAIGKRLADLNDLKSLSRFCRRCLSGTAFFQVVVVFHGSVAVVPAIGTAIEESAQQH